MVANSDSSLISVLGRETAEALQDWARLNDLSVDIHRPVWSPSGKGYTGAVLQALQVAPPARVVILKVLQADANRDEPRAHTRAFRHSPADFSRGHLVDQAFPPFALVDGRVLMFQDAVGDGLRHTVPLGSLEGEEFTRTCAEVVRGLLTHWNPAGSRHALRRMRASSFLQAQLGAAWSSGGTVHARGRQWQLVNGPAWLRGDGGRFPNPYLMVAGGHPELPDPEVSVLTGLVHRDLHLENVLVPRRRGVLHSEDYRLIDLCSFDPDGALTCDVATMVLSALAPFVREPLPESQQYALIRYVVDPHAEHSASITSRIAERVDCIRDTAADVMHQWHDPWLDQFLLSLVAGALTFTSFSDLGDSARAWYFRLAAHAGGQLLASYPAPTHGRQNSDSPPNTEVPLPVAALPPSYAPNLGDGLPGPALPNRPADVDRRRRLVLALEAVPVMSDPGTRAAVLRLLPPGIASGVVRSPITRVEVIAIVEMCLALPDGLARLWDAVCLVDTGTQARDALASVLAEMPEFRQVTKRDPL